MKFVGRQHLACKSQEIWKVFFVHKFYFNTQEYLIAYRYGEIIESVEIVWIDFYKAGNHENFYIELKRFIRKK